MERELWPRVYRLIQEAGATVRQKEVTYQPALIVTVLLWAAIHDRPIKWACRPRNWSTTTLKPIQLPSPATMSRRLRSQAVAAVLRALEDRLREAERPGLIHAIVGKPLVVGGLSHDPDARNGQGAGKLAKGSKLYAIWGRRPMPEAWSVNALNVSEAREAPGRFTSAHVTGDVLGDNPYDSSELDDAAAAHGLRLLAARKDSEAGISPGHYQSPERLRAIDQMRRPSGEDLFALRGRIEASFGNTTTFPGGLVPLPSWVRRCHRVVPWVWAKLIINGSRIVVEKGLAA